MFLDHFFYPPDGRMPDEQGKNIMTLQLRWAGHKNANNEETKKTKTQKKQNNHMPWDTIQKFDYGRRLYLLWCLDYPWK